jgi:hypothetical protein
MALRGAALVIALATSARASGPPDDPARAEARERFDRGLRLFDDGDDAAALAEFVRAYQLVPSAAILLDIGLTYASWGRPIEAIDALERVIAAPAGLSVESVSHAQAVLAEQRDRVAEIGVVASVDGASVLVDAVEAGKTPLPAPLKVGAGEHVVGVVAPGYAPAYRRILVAGRTRSDLRVDLVAMQGEPAQLVVHTHLPGAAAYVDDQLIGTTPFVASIAVEPGAHRIVLRRAGYVPAETSVTFAPSGRADVTLEPVVDPSSGARGVLVLAASETQPVVSVDGRSEGVYAAPIALPTGIHRLRVERGGFLPVERDVTVAPGAPVTARVFLEPTPQTRAAYVSSARIHRTWGIITTVAGAVITAGGAIFLGVNAASKSDAQAHLTAVENTFATGQPCDPRAGTPHATCNAQLSSASDDLSSAQSRDPFGWVAVGIGAAGVVTGVVLLLTGDDPHRYDAQPRQEPIELARPSFLVTPSVGGVMLSGAF